MKLDEVAGGSVYIDTNVLYMYLRADPSHIATLRAFLRRVMRREIRAVVGLPVIDELFYRLLLARVKEATQRNPLEVLRADLAGAVATHGRAIGAAVRKLLALPQLALVGVEPGDVYKMLDNIVLFSLLPRDALHVAVIQRLGLTAVASDDTDFDRVNGIERRWLINPPTLPTAG
ncbi:MAG: type II toxin-antitoxin system VapC family toxin [Thermodesulfobacteriota bacterium]|jgi:predicted nucleic acid-binding protein